MKRTRKNYFDFSRFIRSRHKKYKSPVYGFANVEVERNDKKNHLNKNNKSHSKGSMEKEIYNNTKQKENNTKKKQIQTRTRIKLRNPFS